jgi:hypothetical protein
MRPYRDPSLEVSWTDRSWHFGEFQETGSGQYVSAL